MPIASKMENIESSINILATLPVLNFVVSSILYLTKVKDYIETLPVAQCILICVFIMVFIHLYQYIHSTSKSRSDYFLLFGLFLVLICVAIEGISVYFVIYGFWPLYGYWHDHITTRKHCSYHP